MADEVYWNAWRTRLDPYSTLSRGDTLYRLRMSDRRLVAELRVAHVIRTRYSSIKEAEAFLRTGFYIDSVDEVDWGRSSRPPEGWLIAFNCDVVGSLDITAPPAFRRLDRLGRNGFIRWGKLANATRTSLERTLPPVGRSPVALAYCPEEASFIGGVDTEYQRRRKVPAAVSRAVWRRDGAECQACGTRRGPFQLDHIHPWSKGGRSTVDNLRVLCAACNLAKGARMPDE